MDDIWKDTIEMIQDAEEMAREAEKAAKGAPPPAQAVTYRLRAKSLRQRLAMAWRILWSGNVTIRLQAKS